MREIKFRGKSTVGIEELERIGIEHDNGWVYGNLIQNGNNPYIVGDLVDVEDEFITHEFWVSVEPKSVGQFTGLKDRDGREIYEGDIIKYISVDEREYLLKVEWNNTDACFDLGWIRTFYAIQGGVIGSIYENPELLEGEG